MAKLKPPHQEYIDHCGADHESYNFFCPGCQHEHRYIVKWGSKHGRKDPTWTFNGNMESPTFHPSLLYNRAGGNPTVPICHIFIKDGMIQFLSDCSHKLAGQTVPMVDY